MIINNIRLLAINYLSLFIMSYHMIPTFGLIILNILIFFKIIASFKYGELKLLYYKTPKIFGVFSLSFIKNMSFNFGNAYSYSIS